MEVTSTFLIDDDYFVKCFDGSVAPTYDHVVKLGVRIEVDVKNCFGDGAFYTLSSGLVVAAGKGKSERAVVNHKRSTCSFAMYFARV